MSSTNNQPDTNSNQSSIISDSLLHVLRLHSHLTNRPLPDKYKIHPPVQANIAPIYFHIVPDLERHKKAVTQKFLIVDSHPLMVENFQSYILSVIELSYTQFNLHPLIFPVPAPTTYQSASTFDSYSGSLLFPHQGLSPSTKLSSTSIKLTFHAITSIQQLV